MSKRIDAMTMMTNHRMEIHIDVHVHVHDSTWMSLLMLTISDFESDSDSDSDLVATKSHDGHDDYGPKKLMSMSTSRIATTVIMIMIMSLVASSYSILFYTLLCFVLPLRIL